MFNRSFALVMVSVVAATVCTAGCVSTPPSLPALAAPIDRPTLYPEWTPVLSDDDPCTAHVQILGTRRVAGGLYIDFAVTGERSRLIASWIAWSAMSDPDRFLTTSADGFYLDVKRPELNALDALGMVAVVVFEDPVYEPADGVWFETITVRLTDDEQAYLTNRPTLMACNLQSSFDESSFAGFLPPEYAVEFHD